MIKFSRYLYIYITISLLFIVAGLYSLVRFGLRPAVDFTGGTLMELSYEKGLTKESLENAANTIGLNVLSIQESGDNTFLLRFKPGEKEQFDVFEEQVTTISETTSEILRIETVGPVLGKELFQKTITATIFAVIAILLYIAYAFKSIKFGTSAIIALIHDFLIVIGMFSIFGAIYNTEVDTLFVTAVLTTMSFSVHDTIVVFDRIRERRKEMRRASFSSVCDTALTETMGRSLINSFTIIFMLLSLILLGGESVRWFVIALLIGTIAGTYSSPFIATQALLLWDRWERRKKK